MFRREADDDSAYAVDTPAYRRQVFAFLNACGISPYDDAIRILGTSAFTPKRGRAHVGVEYLRSNGELERHVLFGITYYVKWRVHQYTALRVRHERWSLTLSSGDSVGWFASAPDYWDHYHRQPVDFGDI